MAKLEGVKTLDMVNGEITKVAYGGAEYVKTDSPVQEGDLFLLTEWHKIISGESGEFYLAEKYRDGDIVIPTKYLGNATATQRDGEGIAFRKVAAGTNPSVEERVAKAEGEIESLKSDVAALKGEAEYKRIAKSEARAGDYVKLTSDLYNFTAKDYYEIHFVDSDGDLQITDDEGDNFDTYWLDDSEYEVYRKAGAASVEVEPKPERLKVGDYAKVVKNVRGHEVEVGTILLVAAIDGEAPCIKCDELSGNRIGWFFGHELVRATDEEVAEAKRVAAERKKWVEIGREVGEYKVGDIVRVIETGFSNLSVGDIGPISEIDEPCAQVSARNLTEVNWVSFKRIELITPVEARFDR
ncbi:hypothetical protein [Bacillus inaquosorum]|uniref:hypothetical protein n=1 Tax=Bacillus inaquosorum TaxID=483913 RepID=UPI002281DF3B|nr:hypothetical protein [Bacillus inaquosorum]MCY9066640.1 hypothetical protein [Bacillus inaquosorum]